MAQHTIWVRNGIVSGGGSGLGGSRGIGSRTSAKKTFGNINKVFSRSANAASQLLSKGSSATAMTGAVIGGAAKALPIISVIYAGMKITATGVNIYNNIQSAKTGNTISQGNTKKALEYVTSFGFTYLSGLISNELYRKKEIERENLALDRNRQLYNLNTYGQKYRN